MSKKFSEARKRAFLTYLSQTGNQTLSAERAKVSRSWVCLHRSTDPAFDAACREALRQAQDRLIAGAKTALREAERPSTSSGRTDVEGGPSTSLGTNGSCRPPKKWRYLDGAELVVGGSNRRMTQVRRARLNQWTARVEERFLAALMATCNVKAACAEAGMSFGSAYAHRKRWPAFAGHWDAAIEIGYVQLEAAYIEGACAFLSGDPLPPEAPIRVTSVNEAIQALNMHKFAVKGLGKPPGRRR